MYLNGYFGIFYIAIKDSGLSCTTWFELGISYIEVAIISFEGLGIIDYCSNEYKEMQQMTSISIYRGCLHYRVPL